mmetsp:Transcript_34070/g.108767  ORF Transcript_34070/g.108767 Transcript_34070/m.108767 type:complete len:389 (+) Transcript_34070:160-1326(+)
MCEKTGSSTRAAPSTSSSGGATCVSWMEASTPTPPGAMSVTQPVSTELMSTRACAKSMAAVQVSMLSAALAMLVCGCDDCFFVTENLPSSAFTLTMCPHPEAASGGASSPRSREQRMKGATAFAATVCSISDVPIWPSLRDHELMGERSSGCIDSSSRSGGKCCPKPPPLACTLPTDASRLDASCLARPPSLPALTNPHPSPSGPSWTGALPPSAAASRPSPRASAEEAAVSSLPGAEEADSSSSWREAGGKSRAAPSSRRSIASNHSGARVSVCAALLINTSIRSKRACSASQKRSVTPRSHKSSGPTTSSRPLHSSKSGSRPYRAAASAGYRVVVSTWQPHRRSLRTMWKPIRTRPPVTTATFPLIGASAFRFAKLRSPHPTQSWW